MHMDTINKEGEGVPRVIDNVTLDTLVRVVGENTKIGARTTFMPGRFIGKNCLVGPATLVMHNIDDNLAATEE